MQTYFWLLNVLPSGDQILTILFALITALLVGAIIHRVMGSGTCGHYGNALLVMVALWMADRINRRLYGVFFTDDLIRLALLAAVFSTMLLAIAGTFKSWLMRPR